MMEDIRAVAEFLREPGAHFQGWGLSLLEWTVINSYQACVIIAMFGLILKMMSIDKGTKIMQGSLATFVILQMLGAMLLD